MKNRFFTLFLALVASCACLYAETYSGTCGEQGDNLTWNLDTETGVLTISGTGRYNTFVYLYQNPWDPYRSDIKKIVINEGLTYTGNYMFKECTNLISVTLPESLTELGYSMFDECKNLTDISIPNTVTKIGYRAFGHCEKLSTIHIPESVTSIATEAFSGCHSLSKITVAEENPVYDSRDNCNAIIETATNSLLVGCKNTSIPNSVTSVGKYAFLRNDSITSITIPQTVKSIEYGAFSICGNLQSVTLSSGLQTIGENAFGSCRNLQAINIPNTVTSIESNAFSGCSSLTSVTIPNSVTSIGRDAFENSGLISIVLKDSITSIGDRAFNNCENLAFVMCYALEPPTLGESVFRDDYMYSHFDNNNTILYVPAESIDLYKAADQWKDFTNILPLENQNGQCVVASGTCGKNGDNLTWELSCDGVLTISGTGEMEDYTESATPAPWKSNNTTILSIVIEDGVSNIGNYAFHYCRKLTSVSIPTSITSIGNHAFQWCGNLSSVEIPNSVTNIGWGAFYDCDKLPSVTIPNSVTYIDDLAFYLCESLTSIEVAIDNPNYCSEDGVLFNKDKTTLIQYPANNARTEYVIPNTVTYIAKEAFCRSNYLTSITIPNSVISLDEGAFNDCKFTSINLPTSLISIGRFAFNGCHISTITIPCNVTSIGEYAFRGPGVSSITCEAIVPPSITGNAFETINRAIPLYVPEESISSYKTAKGWSEFTNIRAIPCVYASGFCGAEGDSTRSHWKMSCDSVLTISGTGKIGYISTLHAMIKRIIYEDGITNSGKFNNCNSLSSVALSNSITDIDDYAFKDCRNLTEISIPQNVTSIGKDAFRYCKGLLSITCKSKTPPMLGSSVFDKVDKSIPLYVPAESIGFYETSDQWMEFLNILPIEETPTQCLLASGICGAQGENIIWELGCDSVLTISGTGNMADYSYYFSDYAPWNNYKNMIQSIIIQGDITKIGRHTFISCGQLKSITLPNSITSIGSGAFDGCSNLVSIDIPANITSIEESTFNNCKNLTSAVIPDNVKYIRMSAFWQCSSMTSLTIGNSVTSIGNYAFFGCSGLTEITCKAVTPPTLENGVFQSVNKSIPLYVPAQSVDLYKAADQWKEFNIQPIPDTEPEPPTPCLIASGYCGTEGDSTNLRWELSCDSVLTISGTGAMADYEYGTSPWYSYHSHIAHITVSDGISTIGSYAFNQCLYLQSAVIPNSVITIGREAFWHCERMKTLTLSENLVSIGNQAFDFCTNLTAVEFPATLKRINSKAFANCWKLSTVAIPASVTYIGSDAFAECEELLSINVDENNPNYCSVDGALLNKNATTFIQCPGGLSEYTIPTTVTSIDYMAFAGCKKLSTIFIPENVISIAAQAFINCYQLQSINIPAGITTIQASTFANCFALESIVIPSSVISIEGNAFIGNIGLTSITCEASEPPALGVGVFAKASEMYDEAVNKSTCILYVPYKSIAAYQAADQWNEFTNILPIPGTEPCILASGYCGAQGDNLTWELSCDSVLTISGTGMMATYIPMLGDGVAPWKEYIQSIASVRIEEGATSIGRGAFVNCSNLSEVNIANTVVTVGALTFQNCKNLTHITIPASVRGFGYGAFEGCTGLEAVYISNLNVWCNILFDRMIGYEATNPLYHAHHLYLNGEEILDLVVPNTKNKVSGYAFYGGSSFRSLTLPAVLDTIGDNAFSGCNGLNAITCHALTPPSLGQRVFDKVDKSIPLYVHGKSIELYRAANQWRDFMNILPIPGTEPIYHELVLEVNDDLMGHAYGAGQYMDSTWITIEAIANETYRFIGWYNRYSPDDEILYSQQSSEPILMCGDFTLKAVFEPIPMSSDLAMIYVQGQPVDHFISDNYNYTFRYPAHTPESTLPTSNDITFDKGDEYQTVAVSQSGSTIVINVTSGRGMTKTYVLNFVVEVPNQFTVNASSCNDAWGHVEGSGTYDEYSEVSIMAIPNDGYQFYNWNNSILDNPHSLVLKQDTSFIANFLPDETDEIVTAIGSNTILFEWERKPYALGYWLYVYLDISHTVWLCRVKFAGIWPIIIPVDFEWGPGFEPSYIAKVGEESEEVRRMLRAKKATDDNKISYSLENLAAETEHFFVIEAFDKAEKTVNAQAGTCTTKAKVPTDVENVETDRQPVKFLHNDHIYILRGEHIYDIQGKMVK